MRKGRKPRNWVRLDCQGVLHGSINYIYTLEEKAIFITMIAMAEVYGPEPGLISDNDGRALPKEFVAHELHCSPELLDSVISKGGADKSIEENGAGIRLLNFHHYQFTEYDRQQQYRKKEKPEAKIYGEFKNVRLSEEEYKKLVEKFGEKDTLTRIETLSTGIASKGYRYVDHYATILSWKRREDKENKGGTHQGHPTERTTDEDRRRGIA